MKDLSPTIYRQRLIIEGKKKTPITDKETKEYLAKLSDALNMKTLLEPVTHQSCKFGWAGWIHWESSGVHFYAWNEPFPFFSVDIYTCKKFDNETAIEFTREFFDTTELVYKEV